MSKSWTTILSEQKVRTIKKTVPSEDKGGQVEDYEYNTESCEIEKGFMDFYGYKTSLLWEELLDSIGTSPLLCKPRSSSKLHEFIYQNIDLDLTKIGIHSEDTSESSEEFIE
tara:strand:- start:113 stop:448 length:336 start_codon:yes stop_codon:yes gene_type:complete